MVNLDETNVGDCIYVYLSCQQSPVFAEVVRVLESENAIEVYTSMWGQRTVISENAYWEEKTAKKGKRVKIENNYKQWIKEMWDNEKAETDNRIDPVHNREPEKREDTGKTPRTKSVQKSTKRKQKVVRKSSTKKRKPTRNRKARSK